MRIPFLHDEMDARGKRVLITGASGTFGRAIADAFVARGAHVVGLDLRPQPEDQIEVVACDITDDQSVVTGVAKAIELLGGLDILINNAGTGGPAPAEFAPDAELYRQLEINLIGAWRVTAACVPALTESHGRIVMVASRMAVMQLPLAAAYGVSKRALVAYADALRLELSTHVGVTTVYPSAVKSPIHDSTKQAGLSLEGMSVYEPLEGVVAAIVNAALSRTVRRDVPTSRRGELEFFLSRHLPVVVDRMVNRTLSQRVLSGVFDSAELARGVVTRHKSL
ncbi:MAG: SDR family NAD(P)-dependent oxidoreductase [Candidatus Nanopelagicales bacterium]